MVGKEEKTMRKSVQQVVRWEIGRPSYMLAALALLVVALLPCSARAQWSADANNNIHNMNSGNVGIGTGTAMPTALLEVNRSQNAGTTVIVDNGYSTAGNGAFSGFFFKQAGASRFFFGSMNDGNAIQYGGAGAVQLWNYASGPTLFATNNAERMRIEASGFVGIGTAAPRDALHVHNSVGSQAMRVSGVGGARLNIVDTNAGVNQKLYQWRSEGGLFRMSLLNDTEDAFVQQNMLVATAGGNIGIGTAAPAAKLDVNGGINASGAITGATINATYQDVAEWVPSSQKLRAGTVVVLDTSRTNHVLASLKAYDTGVAGVVSDSPGVILGQGGDDRVKVATTGRVRVRVDATQMPIRVGDLLVTSDIEGVAMRSVPVELGGTQIHRPGTIIGKALEPLEKGSGEILVLLSLQ